MELILWRHAEAEMCEPDITRPLTARGRKQAQKMGEWLAAKLPDSCKFKVLAELAPGASPETVLRAVNWPNSKEPVLIVGHQPTLGMVAATLLAGGGSSTQDFNIRKANVWWLAQKERGEIESTYLKGVMSPDLTGK